MLRMSGTVAVILQLLNRQTIINFILKIVYVFNYI